MKDCPTCPILEQDQLRAYKKRERIEEDRQPAGFECADVVNIFLPVLVLRTCLLGIGATNRLTNDAVAEGWLVRGYRDARGDGTFRTATATYNTVYRRIEATKIETRERGALSPLASSKDAAPRREHENSARENTGFPSGYHQREQHRNNYRE
ncbi:PREDICTED: uncharacterized protein LOC108776377 [Cyphomyrmex costatus]|uniref:uncharacterized protein LOC108776377 n=1 Tax=Cyphomyrmex costatus TaxID=456900 RepID=UPI000852394B|nr:PREDICTED: uncharacterized protein LOC108776377 [Cyphomyrmex costatus]